MSAKKSLYPLIKRFLDILLSAAGMIILSPVFMAIALLILLFDGKPVFYRQTRLGREGRLIRICKFRSMIPDAEERVDLFSANQLDQYRTEFKVFDDPRTTPLGRFLRKTCLDELPQLWNILKGDLSLIGPRPIVPDEICCYRQEERVTFLSVRPGLTGYWQAFAKPDDTYLSGKRQQMELRYANEYSLLFDIKILMMTFIAVFRKATSKC